MDNPRRQTSHGRRLLPGFERHDHLPGAPGPQHGEDELDGRALVVPNRTTESEQLVGRRRARRHGQSFAVVVRVGL